MTTAPDTKGSRTQRRILDAAVERFGVNGFRSTSVAAIARAADVSPAAAFSYWPSKEGLFDAALDHDARQVIEELLEAMTGAGTSPGALSAVAPEGWITLVDALLVVLDRHPLARRVLAGEEPAFIDDLFALAAFDDLRATLVDAVRDEQASGRTRLDLDAHRAAVGIETITLSLAMTMLRLAHEPSDERKAGVAEILLAAFRPAT